MYVVVVGCGKVGYHLVKALLKSGHEVLALERDTKRCEMIKEELGSVVLAGDGCELASLKRAGLSRADVLIAVTGRDDENLAACQLAKHKFNVSRTIALINNPENEALFKALGVDVTVSSTDIILQHIEEEIPAHPLVHLVPIKGLHRELVSIKIPADSPVLGKKLKEIAIPPESTPSLVMAKDGSPKMPTYDLALEEGDEVLVITTPEEEEALVKAFIEGS